MPHVFHVDLLQGFKNGTLTVEELQRTQPLLGVPFTVKESIAVAGMIHTGGLISRRYTLSTRDALVVERLRKAGAILLATTNVSELGNWWESENRLYGATSNPYDLNRTPGGSSGGEAALMCACGTPLSIGSDIGGSLRTPAFFCGLFSHKPTPGLIPLRGVGILESPPSMTVYVAGPITRHAEDLVPILQILADPDQIPAYRLTDPVNLANVRVFSISDDGGGVYTSPVCRELRHVQAKVVTHFLRTHDISVTKMKLPALQRSFSIWVEKIREETVGRPSVRQQLADNKGEIKLWTELLRAVLGRANHTWPSLLQALAQDWGKEDPKGKTRRQPEWRAVLGILQRTLSNNGVLLYPSHPTLVPYHRQPFMLPLNFTYTAIFNALGLPVTQVPLGLAANGLPLGIQVVGGLKMDRLTLAVAADLEKAFGGWRCPAEIL
ncbi:Amidase signature domain [Trinorchestia longiramus]|nr:Amidase signature domain [Trinorchestia longiramus]